MPNPYANTTLADRYKQAKADVELWGAKAVLEREVNKLKGTTYAGAQSMAVSMTGLESHLAKRIEEKEN
jgi:hypothetical protein